MSHYFRLADTSLVICNEFDLVLQLHAYELNSFQQSIRGSRHKHTMSNHTGGVPAWITHEYLQTVLENIFDSTTTLTDYEVSPGSSVGDNYVCQVLRITLNYLQDKQNKTVSIIGKLIPDTEMGEKINVHDVFTIESNMLRQVLPRVEKKFSHLKPIFPRCYYSDTTHKVLFLEDLKVQNFKTPDQSNRRLDLPHSELIIKTLATMHAQTYTLLQEDPTWKETFQFIFWKTEPGNFAEMLSKRLFGCMLQAVDQWPIPDRYKQKIKELEQDLCAACGRREDSFNTILHGDCWMNNMMYRYDSSGNIADIKFLDFQLSNYNSIGIDLNYFLFTSCDVIVLTDHLEHLLQLYHDTFVSVVGDLPGFTLETVRKEFYERLHFGMMLMLLFRAAILRPDLYDLDALTKGKECEGNVKMYLDERFLTQVEAMLPLFEKHGLL